MSTAIYLTDEASDVQPATGQYLRARLGRRSDCCSLVRAVTNTAAGPSAGIQLTRTAAGVVLAWLTDPLDGTDLTAAAWEIHVWAKESAAAANVALRTQVRKFTTAGVGATALDDNQGTELGTASVDTAITTAVATATTMADGDRLLITLLLDDAGTMGAGATATVSYNGQRPRAEGDSSLVCPDNLTVTAALPNATGIMVERAIKDLSNSNPFLTDPELVRAFEDALAIYSRDRPLDVADYLSGDGTAYDFRLPRRWVWGLSFLKSVEHPAGEQFPVLLEPTEYGVREATTGQQPVRSLRFPSLVPASGTDNVLVTYTTRHVHTDELDTVPADDLLAVCWLAGSIAADMAAAKMAASSDSTLAADSVNYRDGTARWHAVAKRLRERYQAHIAGGLAGEGTTVPPAGRWVDWDASLAEGAGDRLYHRRRYR